jgi:hypothetical protein
MVTVMVMVLVSAMVMMMVIVMLMVMVRRVWVHSARIFEFPVFFLEILS